MGRWDGPDRQLRGPAVHGACKERKRLTAAVRTTRGAMRVPAGRCSQGGRQVCEQPSLRNFDLHRPSSAANKVSHPKLTSTEVVADGVAQGHDVGIACRAGAHAADDAARGGVSEQGAAAGGHAAQRGRCSLAQAAVEILQGAPMGRSGSQGQQEQGEGEGGAPTGAAATAAVQGGPHVVRGLLEGERGART